MFFKVTLLNMIYFALYSTEIFKTKPKNVTVFKRESTVLPCSLDTNAERVDMKWTFDGRSIIEGMEPKEEWTIRFSLNTDVYRILGVYDLRIDSLEFLDDGIYTCFAGNSMASAYLSVHAMPGPPNLAAKLPNVQLQEGEHMSINCSSYGSNPLAHYAWYRNDVLLTNSQKNRITETGKPSVKTGRWSSSRLDVTLDWKDNGAIYKCRVSNRYNRNKPRVIRLHDLDVFYRPIVTLTPVKAIEGQPWMLTCNINANPTTSYIKWSKNGRHQSVGFRPILQSVSVKSDAALYTCTVSNRLWTVNSSATLDILYPPTIKLPKEVNLKENSPLRLQCEYYSNPDLDYDPPAITLPKEVILKENSPLRLHCEYDSNPVAESVIWSKDNQVIHRNSELSFTSIQRRQAGVYTCHVTNVMNPTHGKTTTGEATRDVDIRVKSGERAVIIMGGSIGGLIILIGVGIGLILFCRKMAAKRKKLKKLKSREDIRLRPSGSSKTLRSHSYRYDHTFSKTKCIRPYVVDGQSSDTTDPSTAQTSCSTETTLQITESTESGSKQIQLKKEKVDKKSLRGMFTTIVSRVNPKQRKRYVYSAEDATTSNEPTIVRQSSANRSQYYLHTQGDTQSSINKQSLGGKVKGLTSYITPEQHNRSVYTAEDTTTSDEPVIIHPSSRNLNKDYASKRKDTQADKTSLVGKLKSIFSCATPEKHNHSAHIPEDTTNSDEVGIVRQYSTNQARNYVPMRGNRESSDEKQPHRQRSRIKREVLVYTQEDTDSDSIPDVSWKILSGKHGHRRKRHRKKRNT